MTTTAEKSAELQRLEYLRRTKQAQLEGALARKRAIEEDESRLRTELTHIDIETYRLLNGRSA